MTKPKSTPTGQAETKKKSLKLKGKDQVSFRRALKADKAEMVAEVLNGLPPERITEEIAKLVRRRTPQEITDELLEVQVLDDGDDKFSIGEYQGPVNQQRRVTLSKRHFLKLLRINFGNKSIACKAARTNAQTVWEWARDDEEFRKIVEDIKELCLDFAESSLMWMVSQRENLSVKLQATRYYLSTQGKKRGYVEEVRQTDIGDPGKVYVIKLPDNRRGGANIQEAEVIDLKNLKQA